ncbi:MAG: hypothetical protein L6V93_02665 [Clostridiales bacterium]|nr:MAG: hypothetical protein L6V93_02665 [Clostridiales bacterium]
MTKAPKFLKSISGIKFVNLQTNHGKGYAVKKRRSNIDRRRGYLYRRRPLLRRGKNKKIWCKALQISIFPSAGVMYRASDIRR